MCVYELHWNYNAQKNLWMLWYNCIMADLYANMCIVFEISVYRVGKVKNDLCTGRYVKD